MTDERAQIVRDYIYKNVWVLNDSGDFDKVVRIFIDVESVRPEWTAEKVGKRYIDYWNKWMIENEGTEEKYIPKEKKLVSIYDFIVKRMYMEEFNIQRKGRDFYLFGNKSKEELRDSLYLFKNSIANGRK